MCSGWIKYMLLLILFVFSFICMFSPVIDIYGFGSFFVLQTVLAFFVLIDVTQDEFGFKKVLSVMAFAIPFSWILVVGAGLEFLAAFFMIVTTNAVFKRFRGLAMSSENQWRLDFVKITFVMVTALMLVLLLVYWLFDDVMGWAIKYKVDGSVRMALLTVMTGIVSLSAADVIYANHFTQLITTMTDG
jgi:hypothetical protein